MTRAEIYEMIKSIGLPCAYYQFPDGTQQAPPFIVFFYDDNTDVFADDENYVDKEPLSIELYTRVRDFEQEKAVEDVLKSNGITYGKQANHIDSERIWQIAYESEVMINGIE